MKDIKIAFIGGSSLNVRNFTTLIQKENKISATVYFYDFDKTINENETAYKTVKTIDNALIDADFVIILLSETLDEMRPDILTAEKYGIYQTAYDSVGPLGIMRTLRIVPKIKYIAEKIKKLCPNAWVINFTNPLSVSVKTLYKTFPDIKAYGASYEVSKTRQLINSILGRNQKDWQDIKVNVLGINDFTFLTQATCGGKDDLPKLKEFAKESYDKDANRVRFDLFLRFDVLPATCDRKIVEFLPKNWYLKNLETVKKWGLEQDFEDECEEIFKELVRQIEALLGLSDYVVNANMPNRGQMEGMPLGAIVETNVKFTKDCIKPMYAGGLKSEVQALVYKAYAEEELAFSAGFYGDYENAFKALICDSLVDLDFKDSRSLFNEMLENSKQNLPYYEQYLKSIK